MWNLKDIKYMQQVLDIAKKGYAKTWPNPMVGAVLVKNNKVLSLGWHKAYGKIHAESQAINKAGSLAKGATLYINLEPCSHYGQTPPCAPKIVKAGIKRVVVAMQDPNPKVSGRGFKILRQAGIKVEVGILGSAARELNKVFIKNITKSLPWVVCKSALSLDGKIACTNGVSKWISSLKARKYAHTLRALADAIIIGSNTLYQDDPELTIRWVNRISKPYPLRIVLEGSKPLPKSFKMLKTVTNEKPLIIATPKKTYHFLAKHKGVEIWSLPDKKGSVDIDLLLHKLSEMKKSLVLVEGGAQVQASFLGTNGSKLWADEIQFILAPKLLGGNKALGPIGGKGVKTPDQAIKLKNITWQPLGQDMLVKATPYCC